MKATLPAQLCNTTLPSGHGCFSALTEPPSMKPQAHFPNKQYQLM